MALNELRDAETTEWSDSTVPTAGQTPEIRPRLGGDTALSGCAPVAHGGPGCKLPIPHVGCGVEAALVLQKSVEPGILACKS